MGRFRYLTKLMGPPHYDCPIDLPSMTPGESHNEWYHYYCSNLYVFKLMVKRIGGTTYTI